MKLVDQAESEPSEITESRMQEAAKVIKHKYAAHRIAAALVFIAMVICQTAVDIALPNSKFATIDTANLGDLLWLAGLLVSFYKAVI